MDDRGFTLIEIIVAVAILAIISLLIWQTSAVSMNAKERYEAEDIRFHEAMLALSRLADDVSQAFLYTTKKHLGQSGIGEPARDTRFVGDDQGDRDALHFVTFGHMRYLKDSKESDQEEISYYLKKNEEEGIWNLVRRSQSPPDTEHDEGGKEFVVLEDVQKLELQFYDGKRGEWKREWDSSRVEFNKQLPKAVEVTLEIPDPIESEEPEPRTFTTTALIEMAPGPNDF